MKQKVVAHVCNLGTPGRRWEVWSADPVEEAEKQDILFERKQDGR